MKIAVISDTHGLLRPEVRRILSDCGAVIHAGDLNTPEIVDEMKAAAGPDVPFYIVRGNCDREQAEEFPGHLEFTLAEMRFYVVHNPNDLPKDLGDRQIIVFGHSHRYLEEIRDGRLWLNPGSCGKRRFRLDLTMAVLTIEDGSWSVERVEIADKDRSARAGVRASVREEGDPESGRGCLPSEKDLLPVIVQIMRRMDKGQDVKRIAGDLKIDAEFTEQICRIRVTHPGVTAQGILNKLEVNRTGR